MYSYNPYYEKYLMHYGIKGRSGRKPYSANKKNEPGQERTTKDRVVDLYNYSKTAYNKAKPTIGKTKENFQKVRPTIENVAKQFNITKATVGAVGIDVLSKAVKSLKGEKQETLAEKIASKYLYKILKKILH